MLSSLLNRTFAVLIGLIAITTIDVAVARMKAVEIEEPLVRYYSEFKAIYENICGHSIGRLVPPSGAILKMVPLKKGIIGQCEHYGNRFIIKFSPQYWNAYDDVDRRAVFWHESLHCFFNEEHRDDPKHFMNPYYNRLTQDTLNRQLVEYIQAHCDHRQD